MHLLRTSPVFRFLVTLISAAALLTSCTSPALYRPARSASDYSLPQAQTCRMHPHCVISPVGGGHIDTSRVPSGHVVQDPVTGKEFAYGTLARRSAGSSSRSQTGSTTAAPPSSSTPQSLQCERCHRPITSGRLCALCRDEDDSMRDRLRNSR